MKAKVLIIIFLLIFIMVGVVHERVVGHGDKGSYQDWNANHIITGDTDMNQYSWKNQVIENRTDYPAGPAPGQIIFRSDFPNVLAWTGTMWASLTPVATIVVAADGTGNFADIQDGIDALPAGGGVVYIKEGIYTLTAFLEITGDNVGMFGSGKATQIRTLTNHALLFINNADNVTIKDIWFYGSGAPNPNNQGIIIDASAATLIHSCIISNNGDYGIFTRNISNDTVMRSNVIHSNFDDGIFLGGSHITMSDNYIHDNAGDGIFGLGFDGSIISDNVIINNTGHGIYARFTDQVVIVGNRVSGNNDGINLVTCDDFNITGNICRLNGGWGINITDAASDDNIVVANTCNNNTAGAINDLGTGTELGHNIV